MPPVSSEAGGAFVNIPSLKSEVSKAGDRKVCFRLILVGAFHGQISVTRSMQTRPYVIPEDTKQIPEVPEGLKYRLAAFGAGEKLATKRQVGSFPKYS